MAKTICGIDCELFAKRPTPKELATIIAGWNSSQQADFFLDLGEQFRFQCGDRVFMQWQYIAEELMKRENELCDGSGSQLLKELTDRIDMVAAA
jgi:hypothetical protein